MRTRYSKHHVKCPKCLRMIWAPWPDAKHRFMRNWHRTPPSPEEQATKAQQSCTLDVLVDRTTKDMPL